MTDQVEEIEEVLPIEMRPAWVAVQMGRMESSMDTEVPRVGETSWDVRKLLAEMIGVVENMVVLNDVEMGYRDGWPSNRLRVSYHIIGSKVQLVALLRFS